MVEPRFEPLEQRVKRTLDQYRSGEWRSPLFAGLVIDDILTVANRPRILDIGCGNGFDDSEKLQRQIGALAGRFIGVEPDSKIACGDYFDGVHRTYFEDAPIEPQSFDVAYAAFVLEHLSDPHAFWRKLAEVLCSGGVFWGFTMDRRHYFSWVSALMQRARIKDTYLRLIQGPRGYENYPTYYRSNSPMAIKRVAPDFSRIDCWSWNRLGQSDHYIPKALKGIVHLVDRIEIKTRAPGSLLIVRAVR